MKKINCLIADDEALAREILENYISRLDRLELAGVCVNGTEVYNQLKAGNVDLVFLDLRMPQVTGMELLRTLRSVPPVIITTAYREFAVEGYEFNVIDYLVKPISFERFLKAVDKYEFVHGVMGGASAGTTGKVGVGAVGGDDAESSGGNDVPGSGLRDVVGSGSGGAGRSGRSDAEAFIYVKSDKKMVRILLRDILYIEGLKDYVRIHAVDRAIVTYETLGHLEQKLSANDFIRVHRSYIISLQHIAAYSASQVEIGKESIPIGSSY